MKLTCARLNWTSKTLINQMEKGKINFNCSVQRGLVWDNDKKSLLIHSMITGYTIPPFYFTKNETGGYDCIDGKQRSNAIFDFVNNGFALSMNTPSVEDEQGYNVDITGLTFEQLDEWMQDEIKNCDIVPYYYENISDEQTRELFRRLNNGKALSAVELTRVKAKSLKTFQKIAKHNALASSVTEKGKTKFNDENLAMQIYAMLYMPNLSFATKAFRPYIEQVVVTDEQQQTIERGLDYVEYLLDALNVEDKDNKENARVLKKVKSKNHIVAIAYLGALCDKENKNKDSYNEEVYEFFNTTKTSISEEYNETVGSGTARAENVQTRKRIMDELLEKID